MKIAAPLSTNNSKYGGWYKVEIKKKLRRNEHRQQHEKMTELQEIEENDRLGYDELKLVDAK